MDLIRIKNVEKKYKNGVTAIYDLSLDIEKGSFSFVIGGSGSGKSTLIKMLYREEKPTKGQIIVGGLDVAKLKNKILETFTKFYRTSKNVTLLLLRSRNFIIKINTKDHILLLFKILISSVGQFKFKRKILILQSEILTLQDNEYSTLRKIRRTL